MKKLEIYDPAMCCSTGVCGPDVDTELVQFANDLSWLKEQGVTIERFNLSQQPSAFAQNEKVRALLTSEGNGCLPMILVDENVAMKGVYPTRKQLIKLLELEEDSGGCCGGNDEPEASDKQSDCCSGDTSASGKCC